jgi:histidinol-phosphatase
MAGEFTLDADLALAHALADAARTVSLSYFRRTPREWSKADGSIVTEADEAFEDELRRRLGIERPEDAFLGEERGESGTGRRRWIVDAIDGTLSFAAGTQSWGTLIALEVDGLVVLGVCDEPPVDKRYWAARRGGAYSSRAGSADERLRVSDTRELDGARSFVPSAQWLPTERARDIAGALSAITQALPPDDHPALQVAFGGYDVAVFLMGGPWDIAAPSIVVEEAGGRFTDLNGRYALTAGGGVYSNGHLHDAVLRMTAANR